MLRDVEFFKARMAKIEGDSGLGDFVLTIVGNKPLEGTAKEANHSTVPASEVDAKEKAAAATSDSKDGS